MSKYSSRSFNPAISSYYNTLVFRKDMPSEEPKQVDKGLLSKKKESSNTTEYEKNPLYRVAKHMEIIEKFRKEKV